MMMNENLQQQFDFSNERRLRQSKRIEALNSGEGGNLQADNYPSGDNKFVKS